MQGFIVTNLVLCFSLLWITTVSTAHDTINASQSLTVNQTLVSADENYELGFFRPENSENLYLGIWFKKPYPITVVWVANGEPKNSTASLKLTNQGVLVVLSSNNIRIWYSNTWRLVQSPVAQLLNTGNLVVRDANDSDPENFLWQSFDYPSNIILPGMKMGIVRATGFDRFVTSWRTLQDPSPGNYTCGLLPTGYPQVVLRHDSVIKLRIGPWNGLKFSGTPNLRPNSLYKFAFVVNDKEVYYSYEVLNSSVLSKTVLDPQGILERYMWADPVKGWTPFGTLQNDNCDAYALCGAYGSCNVDHTPVCECMTRFVAKFQKEWDRLEWSSGCVRKTPLNCSNDIFLNYSSIKIPDTQFSWYNTSMNLDECEAICKNNCSCTAYANLDIRDGGSGCLMWFGGLLDIRTFGNELELDIYVRMAASEAGMSNQKDINKKPLLLIILSSVFTGILVLGLGVIMYVVRKKKKLIGRDVGDSSTKIQSEDLELPLFDFSTIATATSNFSLENKLGEGGFGPVYKGIFNGNQEIAVKRLSKNSNQGFNEFRNEVMCIAKLQHRNLVKLLGCCVQQEKMLVYEYMPNKSLDFFIFDPKERKKLNWQKRFDIINGIGRGLLYLHQDSRLRIVHRDLKPSNVLLDHDMNPKISDFGLARSFGGNETEANTNRVVGTYGYMSPEYAIDGAFSIKSDVFSYGVLVLEIVAGKKNRGFYHADHYHNLLGHAWKLFKEGRSLELIDELLEGSSNVTEVSRSIHVALLCVQRNPEDRPSMPSVVLMMGSDNALPEPKEPGFFTEREVFDAQSSTCTKSEACSVNEITQTLLCPR